MKKIGQQMEDYVPWYGRLAVYLVCGVWLVYRNSEFWIRLLRREQHRDYWDRMLAEDRSSR